MLSTGAASIVFTASVLLDIKITLDFLAISYLITYIAYSYNKLAEIKTDLLTNPSRTKHIKKSAKAIPFSILFSFIIIVALLLLFGNLNSIVFVLFMVIGSLLYTIYFKHLTKVIVGFKSFYVSFFWASLILLLVFYYNSPINLAVSFIFLFIFLRFIVSTVFFDIKDIDSDKLERLKTLPVYLGRDKVIIFMHIGNIFSFFPIILGFYMGLFPLSSLFLLLFSIYTFYYIVSLEKVNINIQRLSYMIVDGEYLLWGVVIFLFEIFI